MSGFKKAVSQVCEYLNGCIDNEIIQFSQSFEYEKAPMIPNKSSAFVGIASAEYVDYSSMESESGLCKGLKLTIRIDIITPKSQGGSNARFLFDKIAQALLESNFAIRKISSSGVKFDAKLQALTLEALVDIEFMVLMEHAPNGKFNGYEIRKEVLV